MSRDPTDYDRVLVPALGTRKDFESACLPDGDGTEPRCDRRDASGLQSEPRPSTLPDRVSVCAYCDPERDPDAARRRQYDGGYSATALADMSVEEFDARTGGGGD